MQADLSERLISPRCGLVTEVTPQLRSPEEPAPPYLYTATLSNFDFRTAPRSERLNGGKGRSIAAARRSAIGEAVERYAAYHWNPARIVQAPWRDVAERAVAPTEFVLFSDEQYAGALPYARWEPAQPLCWIEATEHPGGRRVLVPAMMAYLAQQAPSTADFLFAPTSNGLAAGPDPEGAVLGGLNELIERDAMLLTWMNRLPARRIEVPDDLPYSSDILRRYALMGVEVRLYRMRTDQPACVVMAVACDPDGTRPARVVGMGCRLQPAAAVEQALFELCQARPSEMARYGEGGAAERLVGYDDVRTLEDHPAFHALHRNTGEFAFLDRRGETPLPLADIPDRSTGSVAGDLAATVAGLTDAGLRVFSVDLTLPDVAEGGYAVARSLVTGLQPIHFGRGEERLGGRRLFDLPVKLGLQETAATPAELNPCPHPMA